jgi:DNA-binding NarL/FixJ family response regulator
LIKVFIIAQALAVRVGLRSLLMNDDQMQVTGEAAYPDGQENVWSDCDVVIWSPSSLAEPGGIRSELEIIQPGSLAGLLLIHDDPRAIEVLSRLKLRGWGMLSPEFSQAELIAGVNAVNEGLVVVDPIWMHELNSPRSLLSEDDDMVDPLTGREAEILQLLALGLTNKQIAARLGISAHTVKFHVSSIFAKMQTTNRTETVKLGLKIGLIAL